MPDCKRIPIQVDAATGLPVAGDNVWLITSRSPYKSVETIMSDVSVLSIIREWAEESRISLAIRFRTEVFLSDTEIKSLSTRLRAKKRPCTGSDSEVVCEQKWRSRFDFTTVYFRHLAAAYFVPSSPYHHSAPFDNFIDAWSLHRPRKSSHPRLGLTAEQRTRLLMITMPGHAENPWQRRNHARNRLVVLLMILCGLRLGEVLSLRMQDVQMRGSFPTLDVRKRAPDELETRRIPPGPKTLGRRLPIPGEVAVALNSYVLDHRPGMPAHSQRQFLILSREGQPCAKETIQNMISVLRNSCPMLKGLVAHRLRNTFTDLAQEALKCSPLNRQQGSDVLTYMGGWSPTSLQPARYSQAWLDLTTQQIMDSIHNHAFEA